MFSERCGVQYRKRDATEKGTGLVRKSGAGLKHPHDLVVRSILADADVVADFLRNYLSPDLAALLDLRHITCESPVSVDEDLVETIGDLRYMTRFKGTGQLSRVFVLVEHQSRSERFFSLRAIEYICKAYWQYLSSPRAAESGKPKRLPYPVVVVLHHGKKPWGRLYSMRELITSVPGVDLDILRLPVCLIDLASIPAGQLKGNPVVRALLDSLQSASSNTLGERYEEIASGLKDMRQDPRAGSWARMLTLYAASQSRINGGMDAVRRVYRRVCAEKEAEKMTMTTAEAIGLEARKKGKAEGRAEGRAEGKAEIIIEILTARFGVVPALLEKKINAVRDSGSLNELGKAVGTCATLHEFKKMLR